MAHPDIDTDALRAALARCENMVKYHSSTDHKVAQNAALKAAGLPPLHNQRDLDWDTQHRAAYAREAEALRAVLSYFGEPAAQEAA